jgi:DNA (cytosine-5)-methyltransferase 1
VTVDIDLFSGPGGWCQGARVAGLPPLLGFEIDAAACATRAAAGHRTVRADVSRFPVHQLAGHVRGCAASPPCVFFSSAGSRGGIQVMDILAAAIEDQFAGRPTLAARRREMARALRMSRWGGDTPADARWDRKRQTAWKRKLLARKGSYAKLSRAMAAAAKVPGAHPTRAQRMAKIWAAVRSASLVAQPARFIHACAPEWVALEQVPEVLPLWKTYAAELAKMGYSTWAGLINAADYGVPQTRVRAILIASRVRRVSRPVPTHYDPRKGDQLWGTPWVSMAEALGWGATGRAAPTVTAGGTGSGGAEPFGHRDRDALSAEREAGRWVLQREVGASLRATRRPHELGEPAPTITGGGSAAGSGNGAGLRWVLHTNRAQEPDGTRQTLDPSTAPAPALTAKSGGQWHVKPGSPDSSWFFRNNNNNNACQRSLDEPAGTLFFGGRSNWSAFTDGERSVRITVEEAAILQSFPADYPWRGTKTAMFTQVGNAVPPLLAAHVLAMATGISFADLAA